MIQALKAALATKKGVYSVFGIQRSATLMIRLNGWTFHVDAGDH
jgi:hypothetical protein